MKALFSNSQIYFNCGTKSIPRYSYKRYSYRIKTVYVIIARTVMGERFVGSCKSQIQPAFFPNPDLGGGFTKVWNPESRHNFEIPNPVGIGQIPNPAVKKGQTPDLAIQLNPPNGRLDRSRCIRGLRSSARGLNEACTCLLRIDFYGFVHRFSFLSNQYKDWFV